MDQFQPLYLSPHLDDAALSCGGLIHQQAAMGLRPLVITLCAGSPDYRLLSNFAAQQHQAWGQARDAVDERRCEDRAAMLALGAQYEHWDLLDCIYRHNATTGEFYYTSNADIFGPLREADWTLIDTTVARLTQTVPMAGTELYAPLTVGHHVDHQLTLLAALRMRDLGWTVHFYEDLPYSEQDEALTRALRGWTVPPTCSIQTLGEEDIEAKTAAVSLYKSQIHWLFGDEPTMVQRIRSYAAAVAPAGAYAERHWAGGVW